MKPPMEHPVFKAIYEGLHLVLDELGKAPEMADYQDVMDEIRAELFAFEEDGDREHLFNAQALLEGIRPLLES